MTNPPTYPMPPQNPLDERLWSTLVHIGGIFFPILAPLIGYLVLKDRGPFVNAHTKTALNFHITLVIAWLVGLILSVVGIGVLVLLAAWILNIVFSIMAAVAANNGQFYRYPLSISFIS